MLNKIQKLDDNTISKIAAGEVVERPAQVVKELVENSIDAESSNIIIEIENGGFDSIIITDDGIGMNENDLVLLLTGPLLNVKPLKSFELKLIKLLFLSLSIIL